MANTRILVVEDESIVALDIQTTLKSLGYEVLGIAASGEEAIQKAEESIPDLVLMDIMLKGVIDGTEAANQIRIRFNIPVVYLTSYSDESTLQRAKITESFGYILKPYGDRDLYAAIEMSLFKYKAEEELRRSKESFNSIVNSSVDGILVLDKDGTIMFMNPAAESLFRRDSNEMVGQLFGFPIMSDKMSEINIVHSYGEIAVAEMRVVETEWNGQFAYLACLHDITSRMEAEKELETTRLQLIQAEKLESVGRLAAGVAHEVKNPLAIILLGLQYLSKHVSSDTDKVGGVFKDMNDAVIRSNTVVDELLDFSASRELDLNVEQLNSVIERSLLLVKHELVKYHITLVQELSENLPPIKVDRNKVEQIFVNIFMNAIFAMPGGGTLTVKTYSKTFTEKEYSIGQKEGNHYKVGEIVTVAEVEDTGTGIPEDNIANVFDPFFTTKSMGEGTGLGLSVSKNIIELHGGAIYITNRNERGVRVTVLFKPHRRERS